MDDIHLFQQIQRVFLPLSYGGEDLPCRFAPGDAVATGDRLCPPECAVALSLRSSVEGVFEGLRTLSHPIYGTLTCAVIRPAIQPTPAPDITPAKGATAQQVLFAARDAAIIDEIDGVPLYKKLAAFQEERVSYLVGDAVDAQPYGCAGTAVLRRHGEAVGEGLWLATGAVGAVGCHLAVQLSPRQRNKLPAVLKGRLFPVKPGYPVGALSRAGSDVRVGRIGAQACLALQRAVTLKEAQHDLFVTVTGDAVERPRTVCAPVGTPVTELLRFCGLVREPAQVILGDALTGVALDATDLPVLPGTTCLIALSKPPREPRACEGCGRCARVCPARLMPDEIARRVEAMQYDRLEGLHPEECLQCGVCAYVCPAGRELPALVREAAGAGGRMLMNWGDPDGT
jgi:electron transport complex protein RnfC